MEKQTRWYYALIPDANSGVGIQIAPDDRRMQFLDCTRDIIQERGLLSLTIDAVAVEAGVSKPFIYKYFDPRLSLLQALLAREVVRFYTEVRTRLEAATDFNHLVKIIVATNFDEVAKGNIHSILISQPDIVAGLDAVALRDSIGEPQLLVQRMMEIYEVPLGRATKMVVFGSGASQAAALHWRQYGGDRQQMVDDATAFIFGGIETVGSAR